MTCPRCHRPGIVWRSTCAGLAVEGCADCHRRWRGHVLGECIDAQRLAEYAAEEREAERRAEVAA